ncbi:MAG: hypothetical protein EA350_07055 [Gemmatimonadales bacterium]|nr:MAG: hypothetical protein EA350_07055 [Gemmatimonadales bacterium]
MNDRIHAALDDDRRPVDLTPGEIRELDQLESAAGIAADHLRARRSPGVADAVMREVLARAGDVRATDVRAGAGASEPSSPGTPSSGSGWMAPLWRPRTVIVRPIWGLLAAAALAMAVLVPALRSGPSQAPLATSRATDAAPGGEAPTVFVQFRLHAPEASEVRLAGSFTEWEPLHALHRAEGGVWTVMVALEPGIHDYAFVVDGAEWMADPTAPRIDDGFGGENSRLALLLGNGMRES